ncbi:YHS domain-containing protein [Hyphococcus sp.]|jgi:YHS domain-containing protein|uniref:YHS domain-containing protein n=1 Tax=Hyphococcus sp. TaxID=2038636 RepID=UPI003D123885
METTVTDPVCKKIIDIADAAGQLDYEGWAYFFCSEDCREAFIRQPSKFASRPTNVAHEARRPNRQRNTKQS